MAAALYLAQVSLYAAIMWGIYCVVWRNKPLHTCSRVYLLASLVLPVMLPFVHLPAPAPVATVADFSVMLPAVGISPRGGVQSAADITLLDVLGWLYLGACSLLGTLYVCSYVSINRRLRAGFEERHNGYTIITRTGIGPGTLGRRIFFPAGEVDSIIVQHELAHIQAGHRYDSLLIQVLHVFFWVSPAHWLIGKELKTVHEFEADRLACNGVDAIHYASLLLSQSFSTPHPLSITHSFFHHPLKRRITMLQKMKRPNRSTLLLSALALTVGFMSAVVVAQAKKTNKPAKSEKSVTAAAPSASANPVAEMRAIVRKYPPNGEVAVLPTGAIVFTKVDEMPTIASDMRTEQWVYKNLRYPLAARAQKQEGHCFVQFIVDANGQMSNPRLTRSSGHQLLDEEAMRLVRSMPSWKPGIHFGKAVAVSVTLPIYFSLSGAGC